MIGRLFRSQPLRFSFAFGASYMALNTLLSPVRTKMTSPNKAVIDWVNKSIDSSSFIVFAKSTCPFCAQIKNEFDSKKYNYAFVPIDKLHHNFKELSKTEYLTQVQTALTERSGIKTVPQVFVNGKFVGGCDTTLSKDQSGELQKLLEDRPYQYDLVVIGGGSGGLSMSREAAKLGAKVALLDYVSPSPKGSKWGLGGTCVNVGCIPKKLMHNSALIKHHMEDATKYGWNVDAESITHDWSKMVTSIQNYIKSLNWGYKTSLRSASVNYINAKGRLVDEHTVECLKDDKESEKITAKHICIAVGERPRYLGIEGDKDHCITSDDIFSMPTAPGKTLIVGASYVALECAGFLASLGHDVTVMVRSILLRGFDQQIANMIGNYMENHGVKFIHESVPSKITKLNDTEVEVEFKNTSGNSTFKGAYNTVVLAVGRDPCTRDLNLENVKVKVDPKTYRILCDDKEKTSVDHIYAVGDIVHGKPQLTPVAIEAGHLLAHRLYGAGLKKTEYENVATTVFTPLEYGACGLSEEDAMKKYGVNAIEVYHTYFKPLEWTVAEREDNVCYAKMICLKNEDERVVGVHVLSPNAGEVVQGFGIGLKLNATKADMDRLIGIHPTNAEIFTTMSVTKSSGNNATKTGC